MRVIKKLLNRSWMCEFCSVSMVKKCETWCNGNGFKPMVEIKENLRGGSTAAWKVSWYKTKLLVLKRQKSRCIKCKKTISVEKGDWEAHHIRERHWGGTNHPRNIAGLCSKCHKNTYGGLNGPLMKSIQAARNNKKWEKWLSNENTKNQSKKTVYASKEVH